MQMCQCRLHKLGSRYKHQFMKTLKISQHNVDIISDNLIMGKEDFTVVHWLMKKQAKGHRHLAWHHAKHVALSFISALQMIQLHEHWNPKTGSHPVLFQIWCSSSWLPTKIGQSVMLNKAYIILKVSKWHDCHNQCCRQKLVQWISWV